MWVYLHSHCSDVKLFLFCLLGNVQEASRLLGCKDVRVNCLDEVIGQKLVLVTDDDNDKLAKCVKIPSNL